jgi:hypothetical protein
MHRNNSPRRLYVSTNKDLKRNEKGINEADPGFYWYWPMSAEWGRDRKKRVWAEVKDERNERMFRGWL